MSGTQGINATELVRNYNMSVFIHSALQLCSKLQISSPVLPDLYGGSAMFDTVPEVKIIAIAH